MGKHPEKYAESRLKGRDLRESQVDAGPRYPLQVNLCLILRSGLELTDGSSDVKSTS